MNPAVKRFAERALVASGVSSVVRRRHRHRGIVLAYHNVLADGVAAVGDRSLHLSQAAFAAQLDALIETHDVVSLAALAEQSAGLRPRVAITFDDAYEGALTVAVAELARRGLPATIFVTPALLGLETWWDVLASPSLGGVPAEVRQHALVALKGDRESVIAWARQSGLAPSKPSRTHRLGTEDQLRRAAASPGIDLGSHTWSHKNLSVLEGEELAKELVAPRRWLDERFPGALPWITYPYGLYSPEVERAAEQSGYAGAFRVDGGWMAGAANDRPFALPRLNIPSGMSLDGFRLRLDGLGAGR